jgi:hypothetical protein
MTPGAVNVLIASPLEVQHASRIAAADPRIRLLYQPGLLPVPRYPCDHSGTPRDLSAGDLARWAALRAQADVSFDFDWQAPQLISVNCPRLQWIQGTSAGIGGLLDRTGLLKTSIICTTAAGVHGAPLAEFALLGLLYFAKDMPGLARHQAARHWERHATGLLRGSRVLLIGLGGVGRDVARLLDAAGVEVYGVARRVDGGRVEGFGGCGQFPVTDHARLSAAVGPNVCRSVRTRLVHGEYGEGWRGWRDTPDRKSSAGLFSGIGGDDDGV